MDKLMNEFKNYMENEKKDFDRNEENNSNNHKKANEQINDTPEIGIIIGVDEDNLPKESILNLCENISPKFSNKPAGFANNADASVDITNAALKNINQDKKNFCFGIEDDPTK